MADHRTEVTTCLRELRDGIPDAANRLLPLLYDELHEIAAVLFRRCDQNHTLQPTALVHEAYLRLVDQKAVDVNDRHHFLAIAAQAMRQLLIDHARRARAAKRGGVGRAEADAFDHITLDELPAREHVTAIDLVALDDALRKLELVDERYARVVELRHLAGLSLEATAQVMQKSTRAVERDWQFAKAWLRRELARSGPPRAVTKEQPH